MNVPSKYRHADFARARPPARPRRRGARIVSANCSIAAPTIEAVCAAATIWPTSIRSCRSISTRARNSSCAASMRWRRSSNSLVALLNSSTRFRRNPSTALDCKPKVSPAKPEFSRPVQLAGRVSLKRRVLLDARWSYARSGSKGTVWEATGNRLAEKRAPDAGSVDFRSRRAETSQHGEC